MTVQSISSLVPYHPYWTYDDDGDRIQNPAFNDDGRMLLNLKNAADPKHSQAVAQATALVQGALARLPSRVWSAQVHVVVVPSSKQKQWSKGLCAIAARICSGHGALVDNSEALVRVKNIEKLATGGDRGVHVHYQSIEISPAAQQRLRGKTVLLLDDITTTGNSLQACALLLKQAGAAEIFPLAIGRTA